MSGPISQKYKGFNIIPPWFEHRFRWNIRETIRQDISKEYEPLLNSICDIEYLLSKLIRSKKETSCETRDSS